MLRGMSQPLASILARQCRMGQLWSSAVCSTSGRSPSEASACPGPAFDGWHSAGRAAWSSVPLTAAPNSAARPIVTAAGSACIAISASWGASSMDASRSFATQRCRQSSSHLKPKFTGGKNKTYSSFKGRFKLTGTGKVRLMHPGHRHKRHPKSADQNRRLRKGMILFSTYANTMKRLGFRMTSY